jgi:quercetin dioxygenase-like cupin family protein
MIEEASMRAIDLHSGSVPADGTFAASVLFEHGQIVVRRIDLASGARIPPCQMQEDVVFVVLAGRVTFRAEDQAALVTSPDAVFIPGGATTRSMEAHEASRVIAVLCRRGAGSPHCDGGPNKP